MPNKTTDKKYLWKFLADGLRSKSGKCAWKIGEWKKEAVRMCRSGFHASRFIADALKYVRGPILAKVEVRGESIVDQDKECWSEMRIIKAYKWTKKDSVRLAVFAARQVLPVFEKKYPKDDRLKKAIEAAEGWLWKPTEKNRKTVAAASYAASSASYAASCASCASAASYAAFYATHAASSAAARKKTQERIQKLLLSMLPDMEKVTK